MKNKKDRLQAIREIIQSSSVGSQEDLLKALAHQGFELTQATLSRDLKAMKVIKRHDESGGYIYRLTTETAQEMKENNPTFVQRGFLSIAFSGNMAVIKTRPGYAAGIASDIDAKNDPHFLGSIAGDDTILLIVSEDVTRDDVLEILSETIPNIR